MSFGGLILTNRGRNLLAKAQTGKELKITRIGLGDGILGGSSIMDLKILINEVKSLNITDLKVVENNVEVTTFLTNKNRIDGFFLREIGIFALDPDIGEILYCYDNSGLDADYIPPEGEVVIERNMKFTLIISSVSNVTASIDNSLVFATKKDLENIEVPVTSVNDQTGAVVVSATDVGLGNVTNTSDANKPVSTAQKAALDLKVDKVSGKGLSTEDYTTAEKNKLSGIQANANNYVHPGSGTNPHGTTKANVGLGSVLNYDIATEAEALSGTSNVKYMTPLRVKQVILSMVSKGEVSLIKSVQRGVMLGTNGKSTVVSHSSVNVNKSFVVLDGFINSSNTIIANTAPIVTSRSSTSFTLQLSAGIDVNNPVTCGWQVVEYL